MTILTNIAFRQVGSKEAERCVLKYPGCSFEECSAAAQDENVEIVFRSFIKKVRSCTSGYLTKVNVILFTL